MDIFICRPGDIAALLELIAPLSSITDSLQAVDIGA